MNLAATAAAAVMPEAPSAVLPGPETLAAPGLSFDGLVAGLEHLNGQLVAGETQVAKMALDPLDNLHHTVIGMERMRLSFELMLAVRNKVLDAYQELMRMQV